MTEKHHVPTHPGENVSPEIVNHAVQMEPGSHTQQDGRGMLTVILSGVAAILLLILIVTSVEAYFYNGRDAEIVRKDDHANPVLMHIINEQQARLRPHWINRKAGTVAIGIKAAERLDLQRKAALP